MTIAVVASLVGLAATVWALYRTDAVVLPARPQPDWDVLPSPSDVRRVEFPLTVGGYDPAAVEDHLERLTAVYADLYAAATPEVRERARQRIAVRTGRDPGVPLAFDADADADAGADEVEATAPAAPGTSSLGAPGPDSDRDALRTAAVLDALDALDASDASSDRGGLR